MRLKIECRREVKQFLTFAGTHKTPRMMRVNVSDLYVVSQSLEGRSPR